ncbi:hypothetical protein LWI28_021070 [Acer negundo]|uniref:Uncharacterized protein n=1 Tax=Acer negundo TaxID=4023 RepID=A0AAD5NF69_ACENE|nr:hypothetical protein LWI28_021070 [Acer negundo]
MLDESTSNRGSPRAGFPPRDPTDIARDRQLSKWLKSPYTDPFRAQKKVDVISQYTAFVNDPNLLFTPLNDTTMPLDDSSAIELEVQTSPEVHNSSPMILTSNVILDSNPIDLENTMGMRYPICDRKEPDSIPSPDERFKVEVKLPRNGEYKLIQNDDDLQGACREFKERSLETIIFDFDFLPNASPTEIVDLISDDDDTVYQPPNLSNILSDGDEDYSPATDTVHSTDNDHSRDSLMASEEILLEDDVEEDTADNGIPYTNSHMSMLRRSTGDNSTEEDQLSNAASLKFDQFDMMDNNSDEDEGISRHVRNRRGITYKEADNGRVVLEVGYLFNNLHHFRQVL